jgi:hypothetical protein
MKRIIAGLGKAITAEAIRVSVKKSWKQVTPAVCKNIRARVLRNIAIVKVDGRNFYDESISARPVDIVFCFLKGKNKHGVFLGASKAIV